MILEVIPKIYSYKRSYFQSDGPIVWMGGSYDSTIRNNSSDYETTTLNPTINLDEIEYFLPTADILAVKDTKL